MKGTGHNLGQQSSIILLIIIINIKKLGEYGEFSRIFSPKGDNQNEMQISALI